MSFSVNFPPVEISSQLIASGQLIAKDSSPQDSLCSEFPPSDLVPQALMLETLFLQANGLLLVCDDIMESMDKIDQIMMEHKKKLKKYQGSVEVLKREKDLEKIFEKQTNEMLRLYEKNRRRYEMIFDDIQQIYLGKIANSDSSQIALIKSHTKAIASILTEDLSEFTADPSEDPAEDLSEIAFAQLMLEEKNNPENSNSLKSVTKAVKSKKRRPKKKQGSVNSETSISTPSPVIMQPPLVINPIRKELEEINNNLSKSCKYELQYRVKRWNIELKNDADFMVIENFTDFKNGSIVYQYRGLGKRKLKFHRDSHNVGWAKHLISGPLCAKYAIQDLSTLKDHDKAFYVSMLSEGIRKLGLIVLGIDKDIYHAQYKPFTLLDNVDQDIVDLLKVDHAEQSFEEVEEKKHPNAPWKEITSGVSFSLLENGKGKRKGIIEVKVRHGGNKRTKEKATEGDITYFHIYPLR